MDDSWATSEHLASLCGGLEKSNAFSADPLTIQRKLRDEWCQVNSVALIASGLSTVLHSIVQERTALEANDGLAQLRSGWLRRQWRKARVVLPAWLRCVIKWEK